MLLNYRNQRNWYGAYYYCWCKFSVWERFLLDCSIFCKAGFRNKELVYFMAACVGCCVIEESINRTRRSITTPQPNQSPSYLLCLAVCTSGSRFRWKLSVLCARIWCTRLRKVKRNREYINKIQFTERNTCAILKVFWWVTLKEMNCQWKIKERLSLTLYAD